MQKIEVTLGTIALIGIILKVFNLPGAGLLLILSLSTLSLFYYLSFALFNGIRLRDIFKSNAYAHTNAKKIIGAVGLGFALSALVMGSLFKLQFYPGAAVQLVTGLLATAIIFTIATIVYYRKPNAYYKSIFKRVVAIGGIGLILYLTPSSSLVDIFYWNQPEMAAIHKKVLKNPRNDSLKKELNKKQREKIRQGGQNNQQ